MIGFADLVHDPGGTLRIVNGRLKDEVAFLDATTFPVPKGDGTAVRPMTVMNPFDEMGMRAYVGRCSGAIRSVTDPSSVLNGLIERSGPGWRSVDFSAQHKQRMVRRKEFYERPDTGAVGFFDAKEFFPNCGHGDAGSLLEAAGSPSGAVEVLIGMLGMIFPSGIGLPIGFEGSGPIANLFFGGVDRNLKRMGIPFLRWTDDLDTFLRRETDWAEIFEMVEARLGDLGIPLNMDKTEVFEKGPAAEGRLFDPARDSVFREDDPVAAAANRFETDLLMEEFVGFTDNPSPPAFRSWLRALRRGPSPAALKFLKARPYWLDRESRAVGDYLKSLASFPLTRSAIDLDWLMESAVGRLPTRQTAAGQMHACRALAAYKVDKVHAETLHKFAWAQAESGSFMALGAWSVRAWAESGGWKRHAATEMINTLDHHGYRRAAAMGFTRMLTGDKAKHLDPIVRRHPEIGPVASLVKCGASPGSALP